MAVVGHAYIVVRALTDKVDGDIRKAFNGAGATADKAGGNIGGNLAKGISKGLSGVNLSTFTDKVNDSLARSQQLAESFTSLVRRGFVVQGAFGAIVGSIGTLVGGLGSLIGAAGAAAGSLVAVGSAAITAKAGMSIASFAMKGIGQAVNSATDASRGLGRSLRDVAFDAEAAALSVDRAALNLENARETVLRTQDLPSGSRVRREAELAYKEAELAYKRAQEAKKQGGEGGAAGGGGGDPYAGLTPAQKTFAKYLASLKPIMDDLREAAAKGFLPILQAQLEKLVAARLPEILEQKFFKLGEGAGKAVEKFTDIFLSGDNLRDFSTVLDDMAENLPAFGTILGNVFGSFLSILEAADPITKNFVAFLEEKTATFANFLDTKQATGELTTFFNRSGKIMGDFGVIFGNLFAGLGNIISANFGPGSGGDTILQWLKGVTQGFRDVDATGLQNYFAAAADNFIAMGDAVGGVVQTIVNSGRDPAVGEFFRNLDAGAGSFATIVAGSIAAAPALGDTLKLMTDIVATLTDGLTAIAFFETLNFALAGVSETLRTLKPLLDFAGPIFATLSALVLIRGGILLFVSIMTGFIGKILLSTVALGGFKTAMALAKVGLVKLGVTATATGFALTVGLGPVVGTIALIIAGIAALAIALGGIKGTQMENATKGVTTALRKGASASELWTNATLAVNDATKQGINTFPKMKAGLDQISKGAHTFNSTAVADSFEAMGRSLGNLALDELPAAQKSFKKFTVEAGLSEKQIQTALGEMDEYREALVDQADQLSINIRNTEGQIDMQKLANFAIGEGEIAQRRATEETQKAIDKVAEQTRGFIDYGGLVNQNAEDTRKWAEAQAANTESATDSWSDYWDGQTFSVDKYLDDLQRQIEAAANYQDNLRILAGKLNQTALDALIALGPEAAAQLAAGLTDGLNDPEQIAKFNKASTDAANLILNKVKTVLSKAPPVNIRAIIEADQLKLGPKLTGPQQGILNTAARFSIPPSRTNKDGGYIQGFFDGGPVSGLGTARSDSIPAMLSNGEFVINARATAQNRELLETINNNESVPISQSIVVNVSPSPGMDEKELAEIVSRKIAFAMTKGGY